MPSCGEFVYSEHTLCGLCAEFVQDCSLQYVREGDVREDEPVPVPVAVDVVGGVALCKTESRVGHLRFLPEGCYFSFAVMRHGEVAPHCTINGSRAFTGLVIDGGAKEVEQTNAVGVRLPGDGKTMPQLESSASFGRDGVTGILVGGPKLPFGICPATG